MKKCFLIIPLSFLSFFLTAQKQSGTNNDFCGALKKILSHASSNFKSITGGSYQSIRDVKGNEIANARKASLKLPGAIASYIENDWIYDDQYVAWFGSYASKVQVRKKYEGLKTKLTACLKNYDSAESSSKNWYEFQEKRNDNKLPKKISISISEPNERINTYRVFVYVFGIDKQPTANNNTSAKQEQDRLDSLFAKLERNLKEFDKLLTSPKDTARNLPAQLKQLIDFGKNDFANIRKEQTKTSEKGGMAGVLFGKDDYTRYATSFQLEGAKTQEILNSDQGWQFVAYFKDENRYDQQPMFREMDERLRKELGDNYTFEDDYDEDGFEKKVHILAKGNSSRLATLIYTDITSNWEPIKSKVRIVVYAIK